MKEEIGLRIKNIRESMNMSKEEFSKLLGISGQYLGIVERGGSFLSIEKLKEQYFVSRRGVGRGARSKPVKDEIVCFVL